MAEFSSEGFDISGGGEDIVHELGGSVSSLRVEKDVEKDVEKEPKTPDETPSTRKDEARHAELKASGNELFKRHDYMGALELYTEAIEECEKACMLAHPDAGCLFGERMVEAIEEREEEVRMTCASRMPHVSSPSLNTLT